MEFNNIIEEVINKEVESRINLYKRKNEILKNRNEELISVNQNLKKENDELLKGTQQKELLETLVSNITIENIEEVVIDNLGFKREVIAFDGMDSKEIPEWFKILCRYFDNKQDILNIFKLFNIEFPNWANNIILPSHYDKNELSLCLSRIDKMYVTNGQIYDGNMGFYYNQFRGGKFNLAEVFAKSSYVYIPYQLLLKNKLLVEDDELFNTILDNLHRNTSHAKYFSKIVEYQDVPLEKVKSLLKPNKNGELSYKTILKKYPQLLKDDTYGNLFKKNISEYSGSELYVLKFSKEIQKEYFKSRRGERSNYSTYDFVKLIDESKDLTVEEKADLVKECFLNLK